MHAGELSRLAEELGLDVVGAAPAAAYEETERHIRQRRERGLFADMRFTMARPEESCHPETLLDGARTVVSAALCYYAEAGDPPPGHGRLPRYTWYDAYSELREKLDALGRRLGGAYGVFVDANQHVDREAAARSGVGFYGKNTMLSWPRATTGSSCRATTRVTCAGTRLWRWATRAATRASRAATRRATTRSCASMPSGPSSGWADDEPGPNAGDRALAGLGPAAR